MDDENAAKMELKKSRKRNGERERIDGEFFGNSPDKRFEYFVYSNCLNNSLWEKMTIKFQTSKIIWMQSGGFVILKSKDLSYLHSNEHQWIIWIRNWK